MELDFKNTVEAWQNAWGSSALNSWVVFCICSAYAKPSHLFCGDKCPTFCWRHATGGLPWPTAVLHDNTAVVWIFARNLVFFLDVRTLGRPVQDVLLDLKWKWLLWAFSSLFVMMIIHVMKNCLQQCKAEQLRVMGERLQHLPCHDGLSLLRLSFSIPKILYGLRTAPWFYSECLNVFDETVISKHLECRSMRRKISSNWVDEMQTNTLGHQASKTQAHSNGTYPTILLL